MTNPSPLSDFQDGEPRREGNWQYEGISQDTYLILCPLFVEMLSISWANSVDG